ncbi:MAG: hypothetical protein ACRDTR_06360 [Rubrobacter sp.]
MKEDLYVIATRNADRYGALSRRVEEAGDDELADFFAYMRDESRQNAEKARRLLAQRVAE